MLNLYKFGRVLERLLLDEIDICLKEESCSKPCPGCVMIPMDLGRTPLTFTLEALDSLESVQSVYEVKRHSETFWILWKEMRDNSRRTGDIAE